MRMLHELCVEGFRSIRNQRLLFGPLNVVIGANGAGKSNLIGVFQFLNRIASRQLQVYTGEAGGANAILHFGRKQTEALTIRVEFREGSDANIYDLVLKPTDDDRFVFASEAVYFHDRAHYDNPMRKEVWAGHVESCVPESADNVTRYVRSDLASYRIYHFHDTSQTAKVKQTGDLDDNRYLKPDASNLAAFLYRVRKTKPEYFRNIEDTVRQVAPFFSGFRLEPSALNPDKIRLEWTEQGDDDRYLNASALSDGTLRFMCLATLLLQPRDPTTYDFPALILIDEPELGLHPAAIQVLAGLLRSAATRTQLLVATQSTTLVNHLTPDMVWVVDREDGASVFRHLNAADMSSWLDDYGLGDLWEKNIIGGRP